MNLIKDQWVRCKRLNGKIETIAPFQITLGIKGNNPITDVIADRPDFKGALYQFLIGLLQTIRPPASERQWLSRWFEPPADKDLESQFMTMQLAFELDTDKPAFMQDYDLTKGEPKPISALLIEAPGGKRLKDNLDHFVKRGQVNGVCRSCAALALFTLQINAPAGGMGHRVGLRGGGPLTTLILPDENMRIQDSRTVSLWHKLWLNVLPENAVRALLPANNHWEASDPAVIFPWLGPTRTSEKTTGRDTLPDDVHPYQMYWGMPRRIRIDLNNTIVGECDLCGRSGETLATQFITKNQGINYNGPWGHLLTPHGRKSQTDLSLPLHGQKGGVTYRHWLGLTLGAVDKSRIPARTVSYYLEHRVDCVKAGDHARIWAFGYDMDNMKARCWYDAVMPLFDVRRDILPDLQDLVNDFIDAAAEAAANLRQEIKKAWYKRPKDVKGDWAFIDLEFWHTTEAVFYNCINKGLRVMENGVSSTDVRKQWHHELRRTAMQLFDRFALSGPAEDMEIKRVVRARQNLSLWLNTGKHVKQMLAKA